MTQPCSASRSRSSQSDSATCARRRDEQVARRLVDPEERRRAPGAREHLPDREQRQRPQRRAGGRVFIASPPAARASACSRCGGERRIGHGGGPVGRPRALGPQLGDRPRGAGGEHDHPVAEVERLLDVVGDQQAGARLGAERGRQPLLHLGPRDRVERRERLVEQQHRLAREQRSQERDALAHPARELARGGVDANSASPKRSNSGIASLRGPALATAPRFRGASAALSIAASHGSSRSRCGMYAQLASRSAAAAAPPTSIAPALRLEQPADQLQQGRLAAARGADEADHLASAPAPRLERHRSRGDRRTRGPRSAISMVALVISPSARITAQVPRVSAGWPRQAGSTTPELRLRLRGAISARLPASTPVDSEEV